MNKETYLRFLRAYLTNRLPSGEVEDIMGYYTEYFEDAGEGREGAVMAELGSPEQLARQILGERRQEELVPAGGSGRDHSQGAYPYSEQAPAIRTGIPTWAYILILVLAAIFAGPVLAALVFGLGLAGLLCVLIGFGVSLGALGAHFSLAGFLYQCGGGLMSVAVGLVLLLGAILIVKAVWSLLRWLRNRWWEGGSGYEEAY